jgi:hypothetical protein
MDHVLWPLGPGSRARTNTECKTPRRGARLAGTRGWCVTAHSFARTAGPGALPHNSYSQCQTAQSSSFPRRVAAPGFCFSLFHPPHEGRAERRKAHYFCCRAFRRATIRACRGAARVQRDALASRRSTVAIFDRGPRFLLRHFLRICAASSSQPGRNAWRAGSRTSRGRRLRAAAAGRHSPLRLQDRL